MDEKSLLKQAAKEEFKKFYLKKVATILLAEALLDRKQLGV